MGTIHGFNKIDFIVVKYYSLPNSANFSLFVLAFLTSKHLPILCCCCFLLESLKICTKCITTPFLWGTFCYSKNEGNELTVCDLNYVNEEALSLQEELLWIQCILVQYSYMKQVFVLCINLLQYLFMLRKIMLFCMWRWHI